MGPCFRQSKHAGYANEHALPASIFAALHQSRRTKYSLELGRLPEWLARGYAGEMSYLHDPRRGDPRQVLEGARSLIVVAVNYNSAPRACDVSDNSDADEASPRGWISRYAWGDDYHEVIQQKLQSLIDEMRNRFHRAV